MRDAGNAALGSLLALGLAACASADPDGAGPSPDAAVDAVPDANPCAGQPWFEPVEQTCDGHDNDCDGTTDNVESPPMWFPDADGDGHGATTGAMGACTAPGGFVASSDDCDDTSAYIYPGRAEVCDGLDNDCVPATGETCSSGCVVRIRPDDNRRYLFCAVPSSWPVAEARCTAEAMRLQRLDDAAETAWARTTATAAFGAVNYWTGGNDRLSEGQWRWPDGAQFWQGTSGGAPVGGLYNTWDSGEPNNDSDEDCLELRTNSRANDGQCSGAKPFVCERY
ncbi:MAG TPA: lectin-like protein [Kofleriaceae bacterium]|nr:lectin-like protein [Kofleriaceae bacterium]